MVPTADRKQMVRKLLLTIARSRPGDDDIAWIRTCLASNPDWTAIVSAALEHGVGGLLCRKLLSDAADLLPADIGHAATEFLADAARRHSSGVAQLLELLEAFALAGVTAVPFKGPALACAAYGEPELRVFRDLDVLIDEADVPATLAVLRRHGYRPQYPDLHGRHLRAYHRYNGQDVLFAENRFPVEPHWLLGQRTLAVGLDVGAMLRRSVSLILAGRSIKVLSPEDALLVATFHGAKEEWVSLKGVVDVAELLRAYPGMDWDVLLDRARNSGVERIVLLGVHLARELLDAPVPDGVLRLIATDRMLPRLAASVQVRMFAAPVAERSVFVLSMFRWRVRERMQDRLRYALATLTTARIQHFQAVNLPERLGFLYPLVKVVHDYVALPIWLTVRDPARYALKRGKGRDGT